MINKSGGFGALFGRREGLAQIPIMVALLLMAVAVPAVTKLVQQNQDTRNRAATGTSASCSGKGAEECAYTPGCNWNGSSCSGSYIVPTKIPTTTRVTPTLEPLNMGLSLGQICSCVGGKYLGLWGSCPLSGQDCTASGTIACGKGTGDVCLEGTVRTCSCNSMSNNCNLSNTGKICTNQPTAKPTTACVAAGGSCGYVGATCCSGSYCASSRKCEPYVTSTPVPSGCSFSNENKSKCDNGVIKTCVCQGLAGHCDWITDGTCDPNQDALNCTCRGSYWTGDMCTRAGKLCSTNPLPTAKPTSKLNNKPCSEGQVNDTSCDGGRKLKCVGYSGSVGTGLEGYHYVDVGECLTPTLPAVGATCMGAVVGGGAGTTECINGHQRVCGCVGSVCTWKDQSCNLTPTKVPTAQVKKCEEIVNATECGYYPGCLFKDGKCGAGGYVPTLTPGGQGGSNCTVDGKKDCQNGNSVTCKKLSNGSMYWQGTYCPFGCNFTTKECNAPSPTAWVKKCEEIVNATECAYYPGCTYKLNPTTNKVQCWAGGTVPTISTGSNCSPVGLKRCSSTGNVETCNRLSNGSSYWQGTYCPNGCSNGACKPIDSCGAGMKCVSLGGLGCSNAGGGQDDCTNIGGGKGTCCIPEQIPTPVAGTPTPAKCSAPCSASGTGSEICTFDNGHSIIQSSLLGCPVGTKRICNCVSGNWSCHCDADGNTTLNCKDSLKGSSATRTDGSVVWTHFDDEASAKCICGANYSQNMNGKYVCGSNGGSNPGSNPTGSTGSSCTVGTPKPKDICTASKLSVNPQCSNNSWDYDEQLCNAAGRIDVCNGQFYCCPTANGSWTTDMTVCEGLSKCTECPDDFACYHHGGEFRWFVPGYVQEGFAPYIPENVAEPCGGVPKPLALGKSKGDANCDGQIDTTDYSLWHKEFYDGEAGEVVKKNWHADFTGPEGKCDGIVDTADYSLWHKYFYELLKLL